MWRWRVVLRIGPTFMGNPLACAVGAASLSIIEQGDWQNQTQQIEQLFSELLPPLREHDLVKDVRWLGAIGVVGNPHSHDMESSSKFTLLKQGGWYVRFGVDLYDASLH